MFGPDRINSTSADSLPRSIHRRGSLTCEERISEISYSMCRVSVESRRHSLDSTISLKSFEMTHKTRFSKKIKKNKRNDKLVCKFPSSQNSSVTSQDINNQVRYNVIIIIFN